MADGEVLSRHRKEKKQLQGKIQALKMSVPKGDRNRKNIVQQQIDQLEKELSSRHASELLSLGESLESACVISATPEERNQPQMPPEVETVSRVSKAAKRREKAAAKTRSLTDSVKIADAKSTTSSAAVEFKKLDAVLTERNLTMHKVPPDGDCLYASILHQLEISNRTSCLWETTERFKTPKPLADAKSCIRCLRQIASSFIRAQEEEFLPFLCCENSDSIEQYCSKLEVPGTWGGQIEIRALSMALKVPIEVLQADGPVIKTGNEFKVSPLIITYHRQAFATGEHYNSCQPA